MKPDDDGLGTWPVPYHKLRTSAGALRIRARCSCPSMSRRPGRVERSDRYAQLIGTSPARAGARAAATASSPPATCRSPRERAGVFPDYTHAGASEVAVSRARCRSKPVGGRARRPPTGVDGDRSHRLTVGPYGRGSSAAPCAGGKPGAGSVAASGGQPTRRRGRHVRLPVSAAPRGGSDRAGGGSGPPARRGDPTALAGRTIARDGSARVAGAAAPRSPRAWVRPRGRAASDGV